MAGHLPALRDCADALLGQNLGLLLGPLVLVINPASLDHCCTLHGNQKALAHTSGRVTSKFEQKSYAMQKGHVKRIIRAECWLPAVVVGCRWIDLGLLRVSVVGALGCCLLAVIELMVVAM